MSQPDVEDAKLVGPPEVEERKQTEEEKKILLLSEQVRKLSDAYLRVRTACAVARGAMLTTQAALVLLDKNPDCGLAAGHVKDNLSLPIQELERGLNEATEMTK